MKHLLITILLLALGVLPSFAQMEASLQKELNRIIYYDAKISYETTPGFVVGIIVGDSTYVFPYGSLSKNESSSPNSNSIFEIGGATKVFTASLVQLLVEEGKMDYDAPLNSYLNKKQRNKAYNEITVLDAITHVTGLPRMPMGFGAKEFEDNNPYAYYTKVDFFEFYQNYNIKPSKKKSYQYSNVSYALLQQAIENVSEQNYEILLNEKILAPIGMSHTAVNLSEEQHSALAGGYTLIGKATDAWDYQSFEASSGLKSSTKDLLAFLNVQLGQSEMALAKSFEAMHEELYKTDIDDRTYIAKGWHTIKQRKYFDVLAHSGSTSGHRMFMGFVKETNTAVVVLSNSENGTNGLGYLVLKMLNNNFKKRKTS